MNRIIASLLVLAWITSCQDSTPTPSGRQAAPRRYLPGGTYVALAPGTPLHSPDGFTQVATVPEQGPAHGFRALYSEGPWLIVAPAPTPCLASLPHLQARFAVDRAAPIPVVGERSVQRHADGTSLELAAGIPIETLADGTVVLVVEGVEITVELDTASGRFTPSAAARGYRGKPGGFLELEASSGFVLRMGTAKLRFRADAAPMTFELINPNQRLVEYQSDCVRFVARLESPDSQAPLPLPPVTSPTGSTDDDDWSGVDVPGRTPP